MNSESEVLHLSYEEIKEKINELSVQKDKIEKQMRIERESLFDIAVEKWKPLVGMCFKFKSDFKDCMFVITDIPQKEYTMMEVIYNRYQLPVFMINEDGITRNTIITSYAVDADNVYEAFTKNFDPVSYEDFLIEIGDIISGAVVERAINKYINS
jgi:hypothetical protein